MTEIEIEKIKILENIRTRVEESNLTGLMQDIKQHGILHPVGVWKEEDQYFLAFGQRRIACCKKLGWTKIPATIFPGKLSKKEFIAINIAENFHREENSPREFARMCKMMKDEGLNLGEISVALSVPKTKIVRAFALSLKVPKDWEDKIGYIPAGFSRKKKGIISAAVADKIIGLKASKKNTEKIFKLAHDKELSLYDIGVIAELIAAGMSVDNAIEERAKYIVKNARVIVNKKVFKDFNYEGPWLKFVSETMKGNQEIIKNLVY